MGLPLRRKDCMQAKRKVLDGGVFNSELGPGYCNV